MERLFHAAIASAEERLWITTAYFVPSPQMIRELCAAAARGIDVRILTNGRRSNHKFTLYAGRSTYDQLVLGGVKIYEYSHTVLHVKVVTVDKAWATIGSANLDYRSLVINDELNISFSDEDITAELDSQFLSDLKHSEIITPTHRRARPWTQRLLEAGSSVFSKQL
jgi:cardiolipin synthase